MTNLIDLIKQQVTPEVLGQLATMTGENKTQIEGAVAAIVPTLVAGALNKSATPAGAQGLLDAIGSLGSLDNFASLLGGGAGMHDLLKQGGGIVSSLFGADANQVANGISAATSIHASSASILTYALAPLALSVVGQTLGSGELNPAALTALLADQQQAAQAALPSGPEDSVDSSTPELAAVPVAAKIAPAAVPIAAKAEPPAPPKPAPKPAVTGAVPPPPPPPPPSRSIWRWLGLLLVLIVLGGLLWWFLLRPQTGTAPPAATDAPVAATDTPVAAVAPVTPTVAAESTTPVTDTTAATDSAGIMATDSVTPTTAAAADTTSVTETTAVTDSARITATGSVTATAPAVADNGAVCTALAQLDLVLGAAPAITTTTAVTDVRSFVGRANLVIAEVATAAQGVAGVDLGAAEPVVQDLTTAVDGLTGDTVGAAAVPVTTALNGVRDAYAELGTTAGCP